MSDELKLKPTALAVAQVYRGSGGGGKGGGGSGSSRVAQEDPDTLQSRQNAKILDLLGEGEWEGLVNGLQSVFLEGTPIIAADGSENFPGVQFDFRTGTQDQTYIPRLRSAGAGVRGGCRGQGRHAYCSTNSES
jgi:predicted phage tail protein